MNEELEFRVRHRTAELTQTMSNLQQMQLKVIQSEKMSALGNLVAGVAHEINNPLGCIVGNLSVVQDSIDDLFGVIDMYSKTFPQPGAEIETNLEAIDLDYLRQDFPTLIKSMKDATDRITSISQSLRTFSRSDSYQKQQFNLHDGIDSTLLILRHRLKANEYRPAINIVTDYSKISDIQCFPGQLNQVFINILANAIDIFDEAAQQLTFAQLEANPQIITIQTTWLTDTVKIRIGDNSRGMSADVTKYEADKNLAIASLHFVSLAMTYLCIFAPTYLKNKYS